MDAVFDGPAVKPTGTPAQNQAYLLAFVARCQRVVITNTSGQLAYIVINDAATPTASATACDVIVPTGEYRILDGWNVLSLGVFVNAASGVTVSGWHA